MVEFARAEWSGNIFRGRLTVFIKFKGEDTQEQLRNARRLLNRFVMAKWWDEGDDEFWLGKGYVTVKFDTYPDESGYSSNEARRLVKLLGLGCALNYLQ
jgi:hypothetical protein